MTGFLYEPPPRRPSPWVWALILAALIIGMVAV